MTTERCEPMLRRLCDVEASKRTVTSESGLRKSSRILGHVYKACCFSLDVAYMFWQFCANSA